VFGFDPCLERLLPGSFRGVVAKDDLGEKIRRDSPRQPGCLAVALPPHKRATAAPFAVVKIKAAVGRTCMGDCVHDLT
jgi:hypothetical protein